MVFKEGGADKILVPECATPLLNFLVLLKLTQNQLQLKKPLKNKLIIDALVQVAQI